MDLRKQLIDACKIGNLKQITYLMSTDEYNNVHFLNEYAWLFELFKIACEYKQYRIMRYFGIQNWVYNSARYIQFYQYCRENNIYVLMEMIKLTIVNDRPIDFNQYEKRYVPINVLGDYFYGIRFQHIMQQLNKNTTSHKRIIYYLECCGAMPINKKLIL